jgi:TRAP transporter TAXI family solute receptor
MLAKKSLIVIFALALAISFAIPAQQADAARRFLSIASGWVTGAYYPFAGAVSRVAWKALKEQNIKVTAESSGASVANAKLIGVGDTDFALLQNDIAAYAYEGKLMFDKPIANIRGMMTLYPETIQVVARKDVGIKSIADLKDKRVSIGPLGSGTAENAKQVLEAYGLSVEDIKMQQMKASQAADYMKDGRIDAYFNTTGVGAAHIIDTFVLVDSMIVPIEGEKAAAIMKKYPFYAKDVVKKEAYKGMDKDVNTIAVMAMMATSESMEADLVYTILKAIYGDLDQISKAHAKFSYIKLEKAMDGMSIPLHAGAEKFFKEKGVVK